MATIGGRIRDRRKALKLRQGDLAGLVGLDQSTISDIERGQGFGADVLMRLSKALSVNPQFVMNGDEGSSADSSHLVANADDRGFSERRVGDVAENTDANQTIPTSMKYTPPNLKSAILLMGSLLGALDGRSKTIIGDMLKDLALHPDDALDIAEKASALATMQKPISQSAALNKAIRGRKDAVETGHTPLR